MILLKCKLVQVLIFNQFSAYLCLKILLKSELRQTLWLTSQVSQDA